MLQPHRGEIAGYWLQLAIAAMLATLGLALDSTAVVIGAMLIAPLMRPIVELAMGLATGSAGLALRAAIRTTTSVALVTALAVLITWSLPFHEITHELEARAVPSLLDLVVAAACALAAAYATLRADADIATTAAGTSVGISLVPPLCAAGYGLGIGDPAIARGAALLFTANLSGILAVAAALFVLAGFGQVDIRHEEEVVDGASEPIRVPERVGRAWSRLAAKRLGPFARIVPPIVLLALVYVPLRGAVSEIGHRNQIRQGVADLLAADQRRVVQYSLEQTASAVILRVVVVGDAATAGVLDHELRSLLARYDVLEPRLTVWAVPDAASMSALEASVAAIPPPVAPEPSRAVVRTYAAEVTQAITAAWPGAGGTLVGVWLDLERPGHVRVIHLGPPIGPAGIQLLRQLIAADQLDLEEDALVPIEAPAGDELTWLSAAVDLIARARRGTGVHLCVTLARAPETRRKPTKIDRVSDVRKTIEDLAGSSSDLTVSDGASWSIVPLRAPCPPPPAATPP